MQEVTPRVNSAMLPRYIGRAVRLDGKVLKARQRTRLFEQRPPDLTLCPQSPPHAIYCTIHFTLGYTKSLTSLRL